MYSKLLIEALVVGIVVSVLGVALHHLMVKVIGNHDINNMTVYVGHLFAVGVLTHVLCEVIGVNRWYCSNGNACLNK
jgi:hypothetical protein